MGTSLRIAKRCRASSNPPISGMSQPVTTASNESGAALKISRTSIPLRQAVPATVTGAPEGPRRNSYILEGVRLLLAMAILVLLGCGSAPAPVAAPPPKIDPTKESWYPRAVEELHGLNREAEGLLRRGKLDQAAAIITKAQPLMNRVLAAPNPTLAAAEAAADLDDLYGRMLAANRNYGWARLQFQKNLSRWTHWRPETEETRRRRKLAEVRIAACDRHLEE